MIHFKSVEFILYVSDQSRSCDFYKNLFKAEPSLNVEGMTEFDLIDGIKLGLMPESGVSKILSPQMPNPASASGIPRCELYLCVTNAAEFIKRGVELGGTLISEVQPRNWGDKVGYISDLDGHIIAFVEHTNSRAHL